MTRMVHCVKLAEEAEGLPVAPIPGALGKRIFENISAQAWKMWLGTQTMLINENRLNLSDPSSRQYLQEQMQQYLFPENP